jgi:hypothetical protein
VAPPNVALQGLNIIEKGKKNPLMFLKSKKKCR